MRAAGLFVVSSALAWFSAQSCSAEALPGRYEASVGGHYLLHHTSRCSTDLDSDEESCGEDWPFLGFDLAARAQFGPWFALGVRASGSGYIDREAPGTGSDARFQLDRDLWLWSAAVEARFDPLIWPRALWIGAELGAVFAVTSATFPNLKRQPIDDDPDALGVLAGIAVGWDTWVSDSVLLGIEARVQAMTLGSLQDSPNPARRFNVRVLPYISLGLHAGYRW